MKNKIVILSWLFLALLGTTLADEDILVTKKLEVGVQVDDSLTVDQKIAYYEVTLESIYDNQDFVVVVKGKTLFDDPEVRMAFKIEDLQSDSPKGQVYKCQSVGREICIIPSDDLIEKKRLKDKAKVIIEVSARNNEKCSYIIEVEYEEKLVYQFDRTYTITLKEDMYKQIVLKFDEVGALSFSNVFAYIVPLDQGLISDKIEFTAVMEGFKYNGIEIWENGLGVLLQNRIWKQGSKIEFSLYSSSNQAFTFSTYSTKSKQKLALSEMKKGYMFEQQQSIYTLEIEGNPEDDLIIDIHPYFGRASLQIDIESTFPDDKTPMWSYEAWASEQIVIKGQNRVKNADGKEVYYLRVFARTELTYQLKAYLFNKDSLTISFHDSAAGINQKNELTNYLLKVVSKNVVQVRIMLFNIQGDNDVFIKQCKSSGSCHVTIDDILKYESLENKDEQDIFIVAKIGDAKREFFTFPHKDKCGNEDTNTCRYMIALKGTTDGTNKFVLRVNNDAQHTLLQNNVPYKDVADKFDLNYYKFQSPVKGQIDQIDFIVTMFIGSVQIRSSRTNKEPRMHDFEKMSSNNRIITYTEAEDGNLSEKTFYIAAFGELDSIYTITAHITFNDKQAINSDPGILIFDGIKQDIILTQKNSKQYFYFKVPVDADNKVPKLKLNIEAKQGDYKILMDPNQQVLNEKPQSAKYKNDLVHTQITIDEGTLEGQVILFGVIEPIKPIKDSKDSQTVTLYFHSDFLAYEFDINKSHVHHFLKKKTQYFLFQIKEYTKYYIQVITNAENQYLLDFYISFDNRVSRPDHINNNDKFKAFAGFEIDQYTIDQYCPFISQSLNTDKPSTQGCYVYLAGYAHADVMATITISNEGSIFYLYEGIDFKTAVPLPNQFSYFVHDIKPSAQYTKIEITAKSHLQIYAKVMVVFKDTQNHFIKKQNFPTSQSSEYQSKLDIFNQQSATIQINTKDIEGCQVSSNYCRVLITVDNLDTKFKSKSDNYMNLLVINDQTIKEINTGKDYEVPPIEGEITYFKFFVSDKTKQLRVELLGLDSNAEQQEQVEGVQQYNYILISDNTSGLPTLNDNQYSDIISNIVEVQPKEGQDYIKSGMYYIGVILYDVENAVTLRVTTNEVQIVFLALDGKQRTLSLTSVEVAYAVINVENIEEGKAFELISLNPQSQTAVTIYQDSVFQRVNGLNEVLHIVAKAPTIGEMNKDTHRIKFKLGTSTTKTSYHILIKIQSLKMQTVSFLLRTKETIQTLYLGKYFKDVLLPSKYRLFDLGYMEEQNARITIFSGEVVLGVLPEQRTTDEKTYLASKKVISQLKFNKNKSNIVEITINKSDFNVPSVLVIENSSSSNEAFYFIENLYEDQSKKNVTLAPTHPRLGYLSPGQSIVYNIENLALTNQVFQLSIFFRTLHILESFHQKISIPSVSLEPITKGIQFEIIDKKQTVSQLYYEFNMGSGSAQLNITRLLDSINLGNIDNNYENQLEYIASLDSQGVKHVIDNAKYYQKSTSKSQISIYEYFREFGTPFIVEVFDCLGDTTLSLSSELNTVKDFSSDLIMRQKLMGHYKYYTFSSFEENEQNEKDFINEDDEDGVDDESFIKSSLLYIGAKSRALDYYTKSAQYILRVSSFPSENHQAFMLPFDNFYLKDSSIYVQQDENKKGKKVFKFTVQNVRCEDQCLNIRAKVNSVIYQLYLTNTAPSLQDYSVCRTNMTNYKDTKITQFPEASNSFGKLIGRFTVQIQGLPLRHDVQPTFEVELDQLSEIPIELHYTVIATVNIQEYGSTKPQNIPIFYDKQKLSQNWYNNCIECTIMKLDKAIKDNIEDQTSGKGIVEEKSFTFSSVLYVFFYILLALLGLYAAYRLFTYCRSKGHYSLKNIFSQPTNNSHVELNDYHSYG